MKNHVYVVNEKCNGSEQFIIESKLDDMGWFYQELTLMSYANCATFNLAGAKLTPSKLRDLANQLDSFLAQNGLKESDLN